MKRTMVVMIVAMLLGVLIIALSASADYTGLNVTQDSKETKDFGWVQTFSLILGANVVVTALMIGLYVIRIKSINRKFEIDHELDKGKNILDPVIETPVYDTG